MTEPCSLKPDEKTELAMKRLDWLVSDCGDENHKWALAHLESLITRTPPRADTQMEILPLLAEVGNILNGIRAADGAPRGYSHEYFDDLVNRVHAACDGDCLTYSWKNPSPKAALQPAASEG